MILKRLYELAEREGLLGDPAFDSAPVACLVTINDQGEYLGLKDLRTLQTIPPKTKKGKPKVQRDKGKLMPVPVRAVAWDAKRNVGGAWKLQDPAAVGSERPAAFLVDTLPRTLPIDRLLLPEKRQGASMQRRTFWRFIDHIAGQLSSPQLAALKAFGHRAESDADLAERITKDVEALAFADGLVCTFAVSSDEGRSVVESEPIRAWWREFHAEDSSGQTLKVGLCQIAEQNLPLADSIKVRVSGLISIGCRAEAYLVTSMPASESLGMNKSASASISEKAVDGFTRGLNALIANSLPDRPKSSLRVGNTMFLFWTREKCDLDVLACIDGTDPELVAKVLESWKKERQTAPLQTNAFYCLSLSGNSARVVVRDYLETPLREAQLNLDAWFADLRIVDAWGKEIVSIFPLWQLALATALDSDAVSPNLPPQLMEAAIKRLMLPETVLAACLRRLAAEGDEAFKPTRLGLIKLVLNRKGFSMSEALDTACTTPAYVCGRLMAVFERLQWGALGDVNANVVDKFYGTASTSPGLVFPRLFKSAQQHLGKLQSEKPGMAVNLQKDIETLCGSIKAFPNLLALSEQGQFALGFYHQRATYRKGKGNGDKE